MIKVCKNKSQSDSSRIAHSNPGAPGQLRLTTIPLSQHASLSLCYFFQCISNKHLNSWHMTLTILKDIPHHSFYLDVTGCLLEYQPSLSLRLCFSSLWQSFSFSSSVLLIAELFLWFSLSRSHFTSLPLSLFTIITLHFSECLFITSSNVNRILSF